MPLGGGFSLPASYEHLNFWYEVHREVALVNKDISLFFLAYTLVPHGTYPSQICEGVEALNYVLTDLKRSPSDVLLAGDSAGGNLGLAILSHITHPIPDVPRVQIESSLKGLVLIGPWVSFSSDWPSHERNIRSDLLAKGIGAKWSEDYLKGKPTSSYAEAVTAPESWWDGVKVEQLLCVAGANEPLIDPITEWVKKYKVRSTSRRLFVAFAIITKRSFKMGCLPRTELTLTISLGCQSRHNDVPLRTRGITRCSHFEPFPWRSERDGAGQSGQRVAQSKTMILAATR